MCMMTLPHAPTRPTKAITVFRWVNPAEPAAPGQLIREAAPTTPIYQDRRGASLRAYDIRQAVRTAETIIKAREVALLGPTGLYANPRLVRALRGRDAYTVATRLLDQMKRDAALARAGDDQGCGPEQLQEMLDYERDV